MCSSYNDKYMIKEGEYIDETGFGGLRLIQKTSNFRYGLDAVPIADMASKGKPFESAVDLGTGTGVIPLILSHKTNAR